MPPLPPITGEILHGNLRSCLLAPEKLRSELRSKGHATLADVFAVVLEPTGSFAVITRGEPQGVCGTHCARLAPQPINGSPSVWHNVLHASASCQLLGQLDVFLSVECTRFRALSGAGAVAGLRTH